MGTMHVPLAQIDTVSCEYSFSDIETNGNFILASKEVWQGLIFLADLEIADELSVSVKISGDDQVRMFWVSSPGNIHGAPEKGIIIPLSYESLFKQNNSRFECKTARHTCTLSVTGIVELGEVFLRACNAPSFEFAQCHMSELHDWLCEEYRILRSGTQLSYSASSATRRRLTNGSVHEDLDYQYVFEVTSATPVFEGFASSNTTFYLAECREASGVKDALPQNTNGWSVDQQSNESESDFMIDEDFLAGSTLHRFHSPILPNGLENGINGAGIEPRDPESCVVEHQFSARPLTSRIGDAHSDDRTLFVRTSGLVKIGLLDGDWALVHSSKSEVHRLVQLFAADELVEQHDGVMASPVLLRNITQGVSRENDLKIRASPFGSGLPPIPIAKTATLARVPSSVSIDKSLQNPLFAALKHHFLHSRRLVKKGDIIAISIESDGETADLENGENNYDFLKDHTSKGSQHVGFFMITNLEYDVSSESTSRLQLDALDLSATGELGCWIDSSATRLVQSGTENAFVPDIRSYYAQETLDGSAYSRNTAFTKLNECFESALFEGAARYDLNTSVLLTGPEGTGLDDLAAYLATSLGFHILNYNTYDLVGDTEAKTEKKLRDIFELATYCSPSVLILQEIDALSHSTEPLDGSKGSPLFSAFSECLDGANTAWKASSLPIVVVATSHNADRIPSAISSCLKQNIMVEVPSEQERSGILAQRLASVRSAPDVSVKNLALHTAALVKSDIEEIIERANYNTIKKAVMNSIPFIEQHAVQGNLIVTGADLDAALEHGRAIYSQNIGAPSIPNVTWDDVGGLATVKQDILDTIQLPLDHPELFADGLKQRSGILLYGPPGTGKTLLAKAVASSCSLNFFSVKGPELLNMYIGESEANVRRVFQRARDAKPCVIFFDELDSVAPKRGNHGDSGGVMDRIVSQLLAELDGMSSGKSGSDVFVIGATNRPDLLDSALLRPGRFDRMLYLGVSQTHEAQLDILEALTRKFRLEPGLDLREIAERCPFNYTGADFYALSSDAMLKAMSRKAEEVESKIAELNGSRRLPGHPYPMTPHYYLSELATPEDSDVIVSKEDFQKAVEELVPSVSPSELEHYSTVQKRFAAQSIQPSDTY